MTKTQTKEAEICATCGHSKGNYFTGDGRQHNYGKCSHIKNDRYFDNWGQKMKDRFVQDCSCKKCKYQWALWKLLRRIEEGGSV